MILDAAFLKELVDGLLCMHSCDNRPMEPKRISRIALTVLAIMAAAVLFATYGTVLPSMPFAPIHIDGPTAVDSDGEFTVVADTESRRALIINAEGDLTGVVSCTTSDSPIDAITDVCVSNGRLYLSGVRYKPDSEAIAQERVVVYDKGGNFQGVAYELKGNGVAPKIKSLCDAPDGVVVAYENDNDDDPANAKFSVSFSLINQHTSSEINSIDLHGFEAFSVAVAAEGDDAYCYAVLNARGILSDGQNDYSSQVYDGHVYTAIGIDETGTVYACDDETKSLVSIADSSSKANVLLSGDGYHTVHVNGNVISTSNSETNKITLCDTKGTVTREFSEVTPSIGFSARMLVVWASGLYLAALALVFGVRKLRQAIRDGNTSGIGAALTAAAVVAAIAIAVGSLSFASYQKMLGVRASEINMCADYLETTVDSLSEMMEKVDDRDALHGNSVTIDEAATNLIGTSYPALSLVYSANSNDIGMYFSVYGKDDKGIFYLYGSSLEYIIGSSARDTANKGLDKAFDGSAEPNSKLLHGRTLRDTTQYRLVQIPTSDGKGVAGVIEIGSKSRSFEMSIMGNLAQRILGMLVLMLVVYLAYTELRKCGRCFFSYRQHQKEYGERAVALLTRPFTLSITLLTSIDSVMTVLIARDLLTKAGLGESSPLLAVPAVMLGVGLIAGQGLYAIAGSRVGLRRLMAVGAIVMLAFACVTAVAVASGVFWAYCVAKFLMAVPFGMLYALGYSLPRIAANDDVRSQAAGGVKRTDTSAAALGTVLGGYAAQTFGNVWVYVLVAVACLPVIMMTMNLLPRGMQPLEKLAQPDSKNGRIRSFVLTPVALGIALFLVLPATLAGGYASFLFPLFSSDIGLSKSEVNNIFVLGQLVVYLLIDSIDRAEARHGKWKVATLAIALLGLVFLLFAVKTTLIWSIAVVAIVGVLCKSSDGWKAMWLKAAGDAGVPAGRATGAMFAARSLALIAQPFILGALLGATDAEAVIVIGVICAACALLFFLITRRSSLVKMR